MPIFDELQACCKPEHAPEWTFELRPPTERYQWPQYCNRFNQENYEEEIVPLCPGKYFDNLFLRWNKAYRAGAVRPQLMIPNQPSSDRLRLTDTQNAAVRRLNDEAFLTYAMELQLLAYQPGGIDFVHRQTRENVRALFHSALQICAYRRDLTMDIVDRIGQWSHYHAIRKELVDYINYIADQTSLYAVRTQQFIITLNMTKYYEGTRYQAIMTNGDAAPSLRDLLQHVVNGETVNYDPHYLLDLNRHEEETRETLGATKDLLEEDIMVTTYQFPSELYAVGRPFTMVEQEDTFGHSSEAESSEEEDELPTPASIDNSDQDEPMIEEPEAM
ncbi:hypothetical protein ACEPAG_7106 [Sanghuangporus baumii]